jgi:ankyrin repeat protein
MKKLFPFILILLTINWFNSNAMNPELNKEFIAAIRDGNLEEVKSFLRNDANINAQDNFGRTPLYWATINATLNNHGLEALQLLLNNGEQQSINVPNNIRETPLFRAIFLDNPEIVRLLLHYGAQQSVNMQDTKGYTPLHFAASRNITPIIQILLDNGADRNITDNENMTPEQVPGVTQETREFIQNYILPNKTTKSSRN